MIHLHKCIVNTGCLTSLHKCICLFCTLVYVQGFWYTDTDMGGECMPMSEAKRQANKKWNDANMKERYDRIQLVVPKGKKELIQICAKGQGESVNGLINRLIDAELERMERDSWPGVVLVFVSEQHPNIGQSVILSHTNIFYM